MPQREDPEKTVAEFYENDFRSTVQCLDFTLSRPVRFSLEHNGDKSEAVGSASPASRPVCAGTGQPDLLHAINMASGFP